MTAHPTPASRLFAVPPQPVSDLTPYRCIWLRENVKGFAEMQDAAEKAMAEAEKSRAMVEGRGQ
jgi:hypothetical protein